MGELPLDVGVTRVQSLHRVQDVDMLKYEVIIPSYRVLIRYMSVCCIRSQTYRVASRSALSQVDYL